MDEILSYIDKSIESLLRRVIALETQDPQYPPVLQAGQAFHIVLTNSFQDLTGVTLTLDPGNYIIFGKFYTGGDDNGETFEGRLLVNGVAQTIIAVCGLGVDEVNTIGQIWLVQLTSTSNILQLQGRKTGGVGASMIYSTYTTITALETK